MRRTAAEFGVPFCVFFAYFVHLSRGIPSDDYGGLTLSAVFAFAVVFTAWFLATLLVEAKPRRGWSRGGAAPSPSLRIGGVAVVNKDVEEESASPGK